MKLTKTQVDRLEPPTDWHQAFYRDDVLKGFGVRVNSGGTKSFFVETRVNGKVRRKTLGRYGPLTVEQARKQAQRFLGEVAGGADPDAKARAEQARQVTLREAFEAYLRVRKGLKARTVADYRDLMTKSLPDWQDRPLAGIGKQAVAKRHDELGQKSPARANNAMRVLRAVFNFARHQYEDAEGHPLFPDNPVDHLSHTRAWYRVDRRRTVITASQLPAWFEAVQELRGPEASAFDREVGDLLIFLLLTGLRRGEALTLKWSAVEFEARTLSVTDTKNREPLALPLSDYLVDLLRERYALADGSPFVFPGPGVNGHLVTPHKPMRKVTKSSGVPFTLHDLRRTFITVAESLDIPVYAIKQLVNHRMPNDVTAGYVVMDAERLREPMQRITDFVLRTAKYRAPAHVIPLNRSA